MTAGVAVRRRSRQAVPRVRLVKFFLTDEELAALDEAAGQAGLARGTFAAEVTMAAARGRPARISTPLREALVELMSAAGLVRRVGTNLNQAVARLNTTGQRVRICSRRRSSVRGPDLAQAARPLGRPSGGARSVRRGGCSGGGGPRSAAHHGHPSGGTRSQ